MESDAYRLGVRIGIILALAVPLIVGVWLAIRWHRRGRRLGWLWGALITLGGWFLLGRAFFFASGWQVAEELEPADVLVAPQGFQFRPAPKLQSQTEAKMRADPNLGDDLESVAVRKIVEAGEGVVGVASVFAINRVLAGAPGQEEGFVRGLRQRTGSEPRSFVLDGESVFEVMIPPTETTRRIFILAWQHENLFISVSTAGDAETARAVATGVIRQQAALEAS